MNDLINKLQDQLAAALAERDALREAISAPQWIAMGHETAKIYIVRDHWEALMGRAPAVLDLTSNKI